MCVGEYRFCYPVDVPCRLPVFFHLIPDVRYCINSLLSPIHKSRFFLKPLWYVVLYGDPGISEKGLPQYFFFGHWLFVSYSSSNGIPGLP
jgi:hypothetical protein